MDQDLIARIRNRGVLPSLPQVTVQVVRLCNEESSSTDEVAHWVGRDPETAARLVRTANSAAFGFPRRVETIPHAVRLLGLRMVRDVTLSSAILHRLNQKRVPGFDYERFWFDSIAGALAARALGVLAGSKHADQTFLAGLVRDIGVAALAVADRERYVNLVREAEESGGDLLALEEERLGGNHAEISAALLQDWGFPTPLTEGIRRHAHPPDPSPPRDEEGWIAAPLYVAEVAGRVIRRPTEGTVGDFARRAAAALGLAAEPLRRSLVYVEENLAEISQALRLDVGKFGPLRMNRKKIEDLLSAANPGPA